MSSLLQSTGSSPYVLVHIVGPLAATVLVVPEASTPQFVYSGETRIPIMVIESHLAQ